MSERFTGISGSLEERLSWLRTETENSFSCVISAETGTGITIGKFHQPAFHSHEVFVGSRGERFLSPRLG